MRDMPSSLHRATTACVSLVAMLVALRGTLQHSSPPGNRPCRTSCRTHCSTTPISSPRVSPSIHRGRSSASPAPCPIRRSPLPQELHFSTASAHRLDVGPNRLYRTLSRAARHGRRSARPAERQASSHLRRSAERSGSAARRRNPRRRVRAGHHRLSPIAIRLGALRGGRSGAARSRHDGAAVRARARRPLAR